LQQVPVARRLEDGGAEGVSDLLRRQRDRDLTRTGMEVSLLGEPARVPRGPAVLALRTGAVLLPITTDYDGAGMHLRMHAPIEPGSGPGAVAVATQQVADAFSAAITEAPSDWHLLQRVFTADLDGQP
jgi:KDO2-lipid IV(A) lauroyltransferase